MLSLSILMFTSVANAIDVDVVDAKIHYVINSLNGTIVTISSDSHPQTNLCLSTDTDKQEQVAKMYAFLLAHYVANKGLVRISYDNASIVSGCSFPLVTEIR